MGTLRSFDQFANAVLEGACERVIVGDLYCDIPLGLYVIRGENVVLIGELDLEKEELPEHMTRVSTAEIKRAYKQNSDVALISIMLNLSQNSTGMKQFNSRSWSDRRVSLSLTFGEKNGVERIFYEKFDTRVAPLSDA
ncbi:hypothetical protein LR48_Vigan11g007700 [Vigna angularis]|uniref:U6 snRNA-associated Sm-like protein LSm1 n=1 Tax=Phaseolus angularis TaxID=3914 RepID=A0A0L9VPR8_PHAAN|nr:hypothetical protein LR48_Vigan11g007700 [Vigna angularis]